MSVTDFECAIAKSQIARYIAGENLAPEVSRQLETHISECPRCKQLLQEKKSSLEAIIEDKTASEPRTQISVPSEPVQMTSGSLALNIEPKSKEDFVAAYAPEFEKARLSLRDRLREQAEARKAQDSTIDLPAVAPAFAHKETPQANGVKVQVEEAAPKKKKKGLTLGDFALYKKVPIEDVQPAMTVENIRSAKEALKTNNSGFKKPTMYLCGLCAVIAAMSFFVKDPTALFGGKAATQDLMVKEKKATPETPVAKKNPKLSKAPAKRLETLGTGTNAQAFGATATSDETEPVTDEIAESTATELTPNSKPVAKVPNKPAAKSTALKAATKVATKPVVKPAVKPTTKPAAKPSVKPVVKLANKPSVKPKSKAATKTRKRKSVTTPKGNSVKLYTPESTPTQEQN